MILDPATLVLLVFAVLPGRARGPVLAALVRWRRLLALPCVAALGWTAVGRPPAPWPMVGLAVFNVWAFALFAAHFGRPRRGWIALAALASVWSGQLFVIFLQTFFEPTGTAQLWFIDVFDKLYLTVVHPVLEAVSLESATGAVLGYLAPTVSLLSNSLIGIHFCVSAGAAWLLYLLVGGAAGLPPSPRWLSTRLGPVAPLCVVVAWGAHALMGEDTPVLVVAAGKVAGAVLVVRGLALLHRALGPGAWRAAAWVGVLTAVVLHRELLWIPTGLAVADALSGLAPTLATQGGRARLAASRADEVLAGWRRAYGPVTVLACAIPVFAMPHVVQRGTALARPAPSAARAPVAPSPPDARSPATEVTFATSSGTLATIDRYEHPNTRGEPPTVGMGPAEAAATCARAGKRLCTSQEWYEACSDAGETFYVVKSAPYEPAAIARLLDVCNVRHPDRPLGLVRSAEYARCRGRLSVHDLVGNAFEWVRLEGLPAGFWGLAGSYYRYSDAQTMSCGFRVLVHEEQLDLVDAGGVGFRCCRDAM